MKKGVEDYPGNENIRIQRLTVFGLLEKENNTRALDEATNDLKNMLRKRELWVKENC